MKKQYLSYMPGVIFAIINLIPLYAQTKNSEYAAIPRIDVHAHFGNDFKDIDRAMEMRRQAKEQTGIDIAMWINLGLWPEITPDRPEILDPLQPTNIEDILSRYQNRILPSINDFIIQDGLSVAPEQLVKWQWRGVAGYKIWCGSTRSAYLPQANKTEWYAVDNPVNEAVFARMEQIGMVVTSIHIADPYLPAGAENWEYRSDAVEYWNAIHAFEHVLERHPDLVVVGAHMLWLCSSKEQLDYLDYLLGRYSNLYVDVTFVYPFLTRAGIDYSKKFFMKHSDRILLGTDIDIERMSGSYWEKTAKDDNYMPTYGHFYKAYFDFFEEKLALPMEALENIYYKNAMKIYPHVKESLKGLGYNVE